MSTAGRLGPSVCRCLGMASLRPASATPWHVTIPRRSFAQGTPRLARRTGASGLAGAPSISAQQASNVEMTGGFLIPGTMVAPPMLRTLRARPVETVKMQWARLKLRVRDALAVVGLWISSKPGLFKSARWRINRRAIIPTAKVLHRTMSEALAAGDRDALQRVCVPRLYNELAARTARRPRGRSYRWTLLGYSRRLAYPRIADHKVLVMPDPSGRTIMVHQAVVTISSRQQMVQLKEDSTGSVPVPGSEKELDLVEHIVLCRSLDNDTFRAGDWKIFGQIEETTYQEWLEDQRGLAQLQQQSN